MNVPCGRGQRRVCEAAAACVLAVRVSAVRVSAVLCVQRSSSPPSPMEPVTGGDGSTAFSGVQRAARSHSQTPSSPQASGGGRPDACTLGAFEGCVIILHRQLYVHFHSGRLTAATRTEVLPAVVFTLQAQEDRSEEAPGLIPYREADEMLHRLYSPACRPSTR